MSDELDKLPESSPVIHSKHHSMFVKDIPSDTKIFNEKEETYKLIPAHKEYRIFIDEFAERERGLHEMFNVLWSADKHDTLEIRISSGGGDITEGMSLYNIITNKFNGRTTTILDSYGYSMGALTFCMGDKRVVTEFCDLMFHNYSMGAYGKGGEVQVHTDHVDAHVRRFMKKLVTAKKFLSEAEYEQMVVGKDYWMDVDELCKRGIATHILVNGEEIPVADYLKPPKRIKKK